MEYIIHLTEKCNLNCTYCYEKKRNKDISFEDIKNLIDYEISKKQKYSIIIFYGGEPLIQKNMIKSTIDYINSKKCKTDFYYGITTNGTLLDDDFIKYMKQNKFVNIAYSIDGMKPTHDLNRLTIDGKGTFDIVEKNAKNLLKAFNSVVAMSVITRDNLINLSKNVEYLIEMGFKYINLLFDYSQDWQDEDLDEIRKQYNEIAQIYADKILQESDVEIPLIDDKIKIYIKDTDCNEDCGLGMKTINVGTDGNFYPCMQFVNNKDFIIGNCKDGVDINARLNLIKNSRKENEICKNCAIRRRCKHTCACRNYVLTDNVNELSPIICETEKIIIEVSDKMAENLYKQNSKMFIQKYYNKDYNLLKQIANKYEKERGL